ncbi:Ig-like domain-containing protein [Enterobacteriaceae bacterium G50]|nr:Ig-like domain-containing protein [Enterobacteriaceae bacterium G50]
MRSVSIISKMTTVATTTTTDSVTLSAPSIVKINVDRADIASMQRANQDLVITLKNGEIVTVKNFYVTSDLGPSQLVLEDANGALWWVQDTDGAFHFQQISSIDELLVAGEGSNEGGGAAWAWILGGAAAAAGIGIAASNSNGSGSHHNDDNGNGNGDGDGDGDGDGGGTDPGNPEPPVDTTPPGAPTDLAITPDGKTITGHAEPGSTVIIRDANGNIIGTGKTGNDGKFTVDLNTPQSNGEHLTAEARDPSNNTGPTSSITAPDTTPPEAPTNLAINDAGTVLTGKAEAGSTITVRDANGNVIGTGKTDNNGNFSVTLTTAQKDGQHLTVDAQDAAHNTSPEATIIAPDTTAPAAPVISELLDNTAPITGPITNNGFTNATKPVLSGSGVAGDTITIFDNGVKIGTVTVNSSGHWSFTPTTPLSQGEHTLSVRQTDAAGNVSTATTGPTFTVDTTPPATPGNLSINANGTHVTGTGEVGSTITITDKQGNVLGTATVGANGTFDVTLKTPQTHGETLEAYATDKAGNASTDASLLAPDTSTGSEPPPAPIIGQLLDDVGTITGPIANGGVTNDNRPELTGNGIAGDTITVFDKGVLLGTTTVGSDGKWSFTPSTPLAEGSHAFTVEQSNASGKTSTPATGPTFTVDTQAPASAVITGQSENGAEISGNAEAGATVTIIGANNVILGSGIADSNGHFTISLSPAQTHGEALQAQIHDAAGNAGLATNFNAVNSGFPAAPVITSVVDDVAPSTGQLTNGQATNDSRPEISGTAEAGSIINIYDNGTLLASVTANQNGQWSFEPSQPLNDGSHALTITATNSAGTSVASPPFTLKVDTIPPGQPGELSVSQDGVTVTGTAEAGSTVTIIGADGTTLGTATTGTDGHFSAVIAPAQKNGETLTAVATDAAGNASSPSTVVAGDTTAPAAPENLQINDEGTHVTGTAEPGSTVTIVDVNNQPLGSATAGDDGKFDVTLTTPQTNGEVLLATATDTHENSSPTSSITAPDSTAPLAPENVVVNDDGNIVTGKAEPGSTVTVSDSGGHTLGSGTAGSDGSFSVTITPAQTNGETLDVTAQDKAGNVSPPTAVDAPDTTPPAVPAITAVIDDVEDITGQIASGGTTNDARPEIQGTADAGTTINVFDNGILLGTTVADDTGKWTFTPTNDLGQGSHTLTVTATDNAGNTSQPGFAFTVSVDTLAPLTPTITQVNNDSGSNIGPVSNGGDTNDTTPVITGSGEPGTKITVYDNGDALGSVTVKGDGTWTFPVTTPLGEGPHSFTATATDAAGNETPPSAAWDVNVNTVSPATPTIIGVEDNIGTVTGNIGNNASTDDTQPTLNGNGTAGSTITVMDNGVSIGSTLVDENGNWTFTPEQPLKDGPHALTVIASDTAGNTSGEASYNLTVDTVAPNAPQVTLATGLVGDVSTDISNGGSTQSPLPVLQGQGEPGATITLYENGNAIGSAVVGDDGKWQITPDNPLSEGSHTLTAKATDTAGNESQSSANFTFAVDTTPPAQPAIPTISDDAQPITGNVANNGYTNDTTPTISGKGTPGDTITLFNNGDEFASVRVDTNGNWTFTPSPALAEGQYTITVQATDAAGNVSTVSEGISFTVDTSASAPPVISFYDDNVGFIQGEHYNNSITDDNHPVFHGTGEEGDTITLYDGNDVIGTAIVGADGAWTLTPTSALADGPHSLTATATDRAGNVSNVSSEFNVDVNTVPLVTPAITEVLDNEDPVTGPIINGGFTNDTTLTFSGTGTIGSTITLYDNGVAIPGATAVVGEEGTWTITPPALSEAEHSFTVVAEDTAGNISAPSDAIDVTVDSSAPIAPTVADIADDGTSIGGTAEAYSTVTIRDASNNVLGTGTADASGNFTVKISPSQTAGEALTATATDRAGNQGPETSFTASNSGLPDAPTITQVVDDQAPVLVNLANGQSTNDTLPTLSGKAAANAVVHILIDGTEVTTVNADGNGDWTYQVSTGLTDGLHTFAVSQTTIVDGSPVNSGTSPGFAINVDTAAPVAPVILQVTDDVPPGFGQIISGQPTNDSRPTFAGTAEAGSTLSIYDNGTLVTTITVGSNGSWSYIPATPLADGEHSFTLTATDSAGNVSTPSAEFVVNVDTTAPVAPTIVKGVDDVGNAPTDLANGQVTNDNLPALSGTAEAGATIIIRDNGTQIGTVQADTSGAWSFTPGSTLAEGSHRFTATATDSAGNVSGSSAGFTLNVDTVAPTSPVITAVEDNVGGTTPLTNGQLTNDSQPTLTGTAEAGATITVSDNGTPLGTTQADGNGNWSFTPGAPLGEGNHSLTVTATDSAGNASTPSAGFGIVVDSVAPTAPAIVSVTDTTTPVTGPINSGQSTNETRPTLNGTGEAGATITVYSDGNAIGTTTVSAGGSWSFTPTTALPDGQHTLTVTATDAAGNISAPSSGFTFVVDTLAPTVPVVTSVVDDAGTLTGSLSSGQSTDDSRPAMTGTAEANATVKIYDNGTLIGTVTANGSGVWNFTPTTDLANGAHALTVTATDSAGNASAPGTAFNIVVDTLAPLAPVINQASANTGTDTSTLTNGQFTNDATPTLSGTAEAGSTVNVFDGGTKIGTVTADANGNWSFTPGADLAAGSHTFTASATDAVGNVGPLSGNFTLNIDTTAPVAPQLISVVDDVAGGVVGALSNGQATNDARPTLNGSAEANSTVKIYDGTTLIGTTTAGSDGAWTFTPSTSLANGSHTFTVTATDAAGNVSDATGGFTVVVDTTAPGVPVISTIVDDVGTVTGPVANGQPTNDTRPTLNGTAEANATVNIYDNGTLVTTVVANGSGSWSWTPTAPLSEGNHAFTVNATDTAGNSSAVSLPSTIVVDTTPPALPTGLAVNATGTSVTGTAEAGSTVTITSSTGTVLGSATADGLGNFTVAISPAQTNGQGLLVYAVDKAGNQGSSADLTAPFTGVPGAPIIVSVTDDVAPVTGNVGNGQSTNDALPTLAGTAQANAIVNIYDNGVLLTSVTANASGNWSYTPSVALGEGSHAFTATATNANGTGAASGSMTVIVDTIAPTVPTAVISADGTTITGSAEANSTVTVTLPGGGTATATAGSNGSYTITLPVRQIEGEVLSVKATDAAGNASPSVSITAPTLPLSASDNVIDLSLTSDATISTAHYSDYGFLLVGALGNVASVLGNDTAQVTFDIAAGGTGSVTIDAAATGVVLSLLNSQEIVIQRYSADTGSWTTLVDSSQAQFANLLTLGASGVTLKFDGLEAGSYRVITYNTNLLATGSYTSLNVDVEQTSAGNVTGETSHTGNVITDIDPNNGEDNAPAGTVLTTVTDSQGVIHNIGASGTDIQGVYGILHINQDGSYTYTLTNTSASVLGRTENFTYTITQNGISDSAQLVVTLGNGAPASTVTAVDDSAALVFNTDVEAVNNGASSQGGFSVVGINLGNTLGLNVLANMTNPIIFDVDEGSTRTMTLQASVGGVALLSTFDLYVYKFNDATQQFEQFKVVKTWLTAPLLGGQSGQLTLTLPGGEYLFLLNNASGVTALTGYTLNVLQDHTYAVESTSVTTSGNVLSDDIAPAGTLVTQVNGVSIASSGTTNITGQYGTLTIDAQGNYTYTLKSGQGADSIKTPDSFVYTVKAPNGDTDSASLNITATPHALDAVNDSSALMAVTTAQTTTAYSDTDIGVATWNSPLIGTGSGSGSGAFTVSANTLLHAPVLHFNIASSGLSVSNLSGTWTLYQGSTAIQSGTYSATNTNITLNAQDLAAGNYTLSLTGSSSGLGVLGSFTVTASITGTSVALDSNSSVSGSTVHGNIYDGTDAAGASDQLSSVHTVLTVNGFNGSTATLDPLTNSSSSATIQGHYGSLQIGIDGTYTYTLNSGVSVASMTTKETFTYTLNDQNGHTDSATLTINMNPQFVSTAQSDVINGSAYGDTLIYHLLNSTNATGGNGADVWNNFSLAQGDQINIHDLLVGWNGQQSTLGNYLNVTTSGNNTVISIDRDGTGSTYHSTQLITLENVHTTLDELVQQNHIVT